MKEETILRLEIKQTGNEIFIDILDNFYNIIKKTIYNKKTAKKIFDIIENQ